MNNHRLTESTIGSAKVIVDILPKGKVIPNTQITPTSITIHQTGNPNASASANHRYMKNCNKSGDRIASWHITVGYDEIIQAQSFNYKTYHAGCTKGNNTSIGIEICMYHDKEKQKQAYVNAIELVRIIMKYYGWGLDKVKRHFDWTNKHCPAWLIEGKYGYTWAWFKQNLSDNEVLGFEPYRIKVIYPGKDGLNVRKSASFSSDIVCQVFMGDIYTIVEEKNGLGKLKSGAGWISLNPTYVKKL